MRHFALSPHGKVLAVREDDKTVRLRTYDTATGARTDLGELEYNTYRFEFSANSKRLVVSETSAERREPRSFLACYDVPAGKRLWKLPAEREPVRRQPGWSARRVRLVQAARLPADRDRPENRARRPKRTSHRRSGRPTRTSTSPSLPDGRTLVACHFDALVLWDVRDGKEVRRIPVSADGLVGYGPQLGGFSADSKTVVTTRGGLRRRDLTTGKPLFDPDPGDGLGGSVERLAFTPDGKEVFASGWNLDSGRWDVATGKRLAYHRERFGYRLVTIPGGLRSVGADEYQKPHEVVVYDPVGARALKTVRWAAEGEVGINGLRAYSLSADGRTLLVLHCDEPARGKNSYVTVYDIVADRQLARHTLPGLLYYVESPFSPCGRWLAFGGKVYHARTGTELFTPAAGASERLMVGEMWNTAPTWFGSRPADGRPAGEGRQDGRRPGRVGAGLRPGARAIVRRGPGRPGGVRPGRAVGRGGRRPRSARPRPAHG